MMMTRSQLSFFTVKYILILWSKYIPFLNMHMCWCDCSCVRCACICMYEWHLTTRAWCLLFYTLFYFLLCFQLELEDLARQCLLYLAPNVWGTNSQEKTFFSWGFLATNTQQDCTCFFSYPLSVSVSLPLFIVVLQTLPECLSQVPSKLGSCLEIQSGFTVVCSSNQPYIFINIIGRFGKTIGNS